MVLTTRKTRHNGGRFNGHAKKTQLDGRVAVAASLLVIVVIVVDGVESCCALSSSLMAQSANRFFVTSQSPIDFLLFGSVYPSRFTVSRGSGVAIYRPADPVNSQISCPLFHHHRAAHY